MTYGAEQVEADAIRAALKNPKESICMAWFTAARQPVRKKRRKGGGGIRPDRLNMTIYGSRMIWYTGSDDSWDGGAYGNQACCH